MKAERHTPPYRGEYDYRQGFGFERPLPKYLDELVTAIHGALRDDSSAGIVCTINQGPGQPRYRLVLDGAGMILTTRSHGEEEDTTRPIGRFEELGGIRDIMAQLVAGGGLPEAPLAEHVHVEIL